MHVLFKHIFKFQIRFKCGLGDLQEPLKEHKLRGGGQGKSDNRHCDLRGLFWQPSRTYQQMGNLQCGHSALPGMVGQESWEVLCNAGLPMLSVPISKLGHDKGRPSACFAEISRLFPEMLRAEPGLG